MLILSIAFYFYFVTLLLSPTALLAAGQNDWRTSRHITKLSESKSLEKKETPQP